MMTYLPGSEVSLMCYIQPAKPVEILVQLLEDLELVALIHSHRHEMPILVSLACL